VVRAVRAAHLRDAAISTRPGRTVEVAELLDPPVNTAAMSIHHEDVRRALPDWQPRAAVKVEFSRSPETIGPVRAARRRL